MTNAANVVAISNSNSIRNEISDLKSSLKFMDWTIQLQSIAAFAGMPVCEELGVDGAIVPAHSAAGRMGYSSIKSLVTDPAGLAMNWDDWTSRVTAFGYREKYGIYASSAKEINLEFKDVCAILKRAPANSMEFHMAKDAALLMQKQGLERQFAEEQIRAHKIAKDLGQRTQELSAKVDENTLLRSSLEQEIKNAQSNLELAQISFDKKKELEFAAIKSEHERTLQEHIRATQQKSEQEIKALTSEMEQVKSYYNSDYFVTRSEYEVVEQELASERNNNRDYIRKLNDLTKNYECILAQVNGLMESEGNLQSQLENAESHIQSLKNEIVELNNLGAGDITRGALHMQQKIMELDFTVNKLKEANGTMSKKLDLQDRNISILKTNFGNAVASNEKIREFAKLQIVKIDKLKIQKLIAYSLIAIVSMAAFGLIAVAG